MDFEDVAHLYKSGEINREEVFLECENLGMFEINENGEIWKVAQRAGNGNRLISITQRQIGNQLKCGSIICGVSLDGNIISSRRPRIIWAKFIGKIPNGMCIIHKNGVYNDDRISNLDIVKRGEHTFYYSEKFNISPFGENHYNSKLTNEQCLDIYKRLNNGEAAIKLSNEYNISCFSIYDIKRKRYWRKITDIKKEKTN